MKNQEPRPQDPRPDDLPAFVDAYFSHLTFAPHIPADVQKFIKGHLNAFALVMRAKYTPRPGVFAADLTPEELVELTRKKPGNVMFTPTDENGFPRQDVENSQAQYVQPPCESVRELDHACEVTVAELRAKGVL